MSDQTETLDAILAEMRGIAGNMETAARKFDVEHRQDKRCLKHPHCFRADDLLRDANGLRDWADRIEAAAERERAEFRRQLRNEIQINDALATVRPQLHYVDNVIAEAAKERAHEIELAKLRAPGNAAAMRAALAESTALLAVVRGDEYEENITRQISRNTDVLSAPARNCDRFATAEEARKAFEEEHSREIVHNLYTAAFDWLFAPAEGGSHA